MSGAEIIASLTGLVNVWLTVKNSIWNWIWGIVSVALFGYVFLHSRLYSNAGLQLLYFLPMQFYGWWMWARGGHMSRKREPSRARGGRFDPACACLPLSRRINPTIGFKQASPAA